MEKGDCLNGGLLIAYGQTGKLFEFLINGLILRNVDIGPIAFVDDSEVTHEVYKIICIDLVLETFDFHDS